MIIRLIGGIVDRLFALGGALALSQAPLFVQQYKQQLMGRVEELNLQIHVLKEAARLSDKTLEQYIAKFVQNADPDFSRQGEIMQGMVVRWTNLNQGLHALNEANLWKKPLAFMHYYNEDVVQATWKHFEIGIPMNVEGAVYGLVGLAIGFFVFSLIKTFLGFLWKGCLSLMSFRKASPT